MRQTLEDALQHHRAGRLTEAELLYQQVLAQHPSQPDALGLLGVLYSQTAQHAKARDLITRAIAASPEVPHYHTNLGAAFAAEGRYEEAIPAYRRAISLQPANAIAHENLANALFQTGQIDQAIAAYREAIKLNPRYLEAHTGLAQALKNTDRLEEAIPILSRIIELQPKHIKALTNLASALQKLGRYAESITASRRAIALEPTSADAHVNLGAALMQTGQYAAASSSFQQAITARPDHAQAHWNQSLLLLLRGQYAQGWPEYEWRLKTPAFAPIRSRFPQPQWDGSPLSGRRILLYADQGLGDCFQFLRYLPLVASRGGKIVLSLPSELTRLVQSTDPTNQPAVAESPSAIDLCCSLSSLPFLFGTTLETIPANFPYLFADADLTRHWNTRLPATPGIKVGLVWAGNPRHANDRNRSLAASALAPLASVPGITFVSLQQGPRAAQANDLGEPLRPLDFSSELNDFADTAALIANLDLVISVDTAVAHLAGAMAKPVWLLLPFCPDWRWMLDRSDPPWYPSVRLFRQPAAGDWQIPIQQIAEALRKMSA